jgi:serine/threonine protein kinase
MSIFCNKCNYENGNDSRFCQVCGEKLTDVIYRGTLKPGVILNKRYEIKNLIKTGGFGSVYEAIDHKATRAICAIKEMLDDPDSTTEERKYLITRFTRETEIFHKLKHPNLAVSKDSFVENSRFYLVMDYIDGDDLETVMKNYPGGVPEELVINWAKQILDGLIYLHSQTPPVIYRDLKPENIMIKKSDGVIVLIDFGLARTINPGSNMTMTAIGTPQFAPEELFVGKPEQRTDIYSLGATMHCLLTGVMPVTLFHFKPVRELNQNISEEMENIIIHTLGRNPEDRYENALAMKKDIDKLKVKILPLKETQKKSAPVSEKKNGKKTSLSRKLIIPAVSLGCIGIISISVILVIVILLIVLYMIVKS